MTARGRGHLTWSDTIILFHGLQLLPALTALTCLRLEANGLRELPACVGALFHLKELAIFGNELKTLPAELGRCTATFSLIFTPFLPHYRLCQVVPLHMCVLP